MKLFILKNTDAAIYFFMDMDSREYFWLVENTPHQDVAKAGWDYNQSFLTLMTDIFSY